MSENVDYGDLPAMPLGTLEVMMDVHPETGQPAVCFLMRMAELGTVAAVWYEVAALRVVAERVQQALAELEQISGQEQDHG